MKPGEKQEAHKRLVIPILVCSECLHWQEQNELNMPDKVFCPVHPNRELIPTTADATVRYA